MSYNQYIRGVLCDIIVAVNKFTKSSSIFFQYVDRYAISENSFNSLEQDNSILGSGNFEILKGGTFYDEDDYLRPYRLVLNQ